MPEKKLVIIEIGWFITGLVISILLLLLIGYDQVQGLVITLNYRDTYFVGNIISISTGIAIFLYSQFSFARRLISSKNRLLRLSSSISIVTLLLLILFIIYNIPELIISNQLINSESGWTIYPPLSAISGESSNIENESLTFNEIGKYMLGLLSLLILELFSLSVIKK